MNPQQTARERDRLFFQRLVLSLIIFFTLIFVCLSIPDHLRDRPYWQQCERMGIPFTPDWIWKLTH